MSNLIQTSFHTLCGMVHLCKLNWPHPRTFTSVILPLHCLLIFKTLWTVMWIAIWEIFKKSSWFTIEGHQTLTSEVIPKSSLFSFHFFCHLAHFNSIFYFSVYCLHLRICQTQIVLYVFSLGVELMTLGQFNINIKHMPF